MDEVERRVIHEQRPSRLEEQRGRLAERRSRPRRIGGNDGVEPKGGEGVHYCMPVGRLTTRTVLVRYYCSAVEVQILECYSSSPSASCPAAPIRRRC